MTNQELIQHFYQSFVNEDVEAMVSCYHQDIYFHDPAFGPLQGEDARNMWRMLLSRNRGGIKVTFDTAQADEKTGSANWQATYIFSQTGRTVFNKISAKFEFQDGKIIRHIDDFNLYRWTCQAMGWKGYLLGWTPFIQQKIREQTAGLLRKFTEKQ